MKRWIVWGAAVLALAGAGLAMAEENYPNSVVPDHRPVVLGTVVGTTSHTVTVHTNEAERMVFEVDSRTMMPRNLQTGTPVRVEFHLMPSGEHHAGRITPLEHNSLLGTPDQAVPPADMPTGANIDAHHRTDGAVHANATETHTHADGVTHTHDDAGTSTTTADNVIVDENARAAHTDDRAMTADDGQLPQTASAQPWLLTFGLAACAGALGLMVGRRQRTT